MTAVAASKIHADFHEAIGGDCLIGREIYERMRRLDPEYTLAEVSALISAMRASGELERVIIEGWPYSYQLPKPPAAPKSDAEVWADFRRKMDERFGGFSALSPERQREAQRILDQAAQDKLEGGESAFRRSRPARVRQVLLESVLEGLRRKRPNSEFVVISERVAR